MSPRHDSDQTGGSKLVYTSDGGRVGGAVDEASGRPPRAPKRGKPKPPDVPKDGVVRVLRSTKGRKGKGVTIITGIPATGDELRALAKQLKQRCGSGGAVKGDVVEVQGDHRDTVVAWLADRGYTVKLAGG